MKCAHPGCKCAVTNNQYGNYCSQHCQDLADAAEPQCQCHHAQCK